jgi:hypothetical protein
MPRAQRAGQIVDLRISERRLGLVLDDKPVAQTARVAAGKRSGDNGFGELRILQRGAVHGAAARLVGQQKRASSTAFGEPEQSEPFSGRLVSCNHETPTPTSVLRLREAEKPLGVEIVRRLGRVGARWRAWWSALHDWYEDSALSPPVRTRPVYVLWSVLLSQFTPLCGHAPDPPRKVEYAERPMGGSVVGR